MHSGKKRRGALWLTAMHCGKNNKDFCVDGTISSQSSFDKIVTYFFWSTPRRRRDENWLHEARSLISHTTFKISNVLQASIPQQYLYVDSRWTTSCSPSVCYHSRYQLESSQIGSYYPVFPSLIFAPSRNRRGYFWNLHLLHTLNRESRASNKETPESRKNNYGPSYSQCNPSIHHFHISHNNRICPQKNCISIVFNFSWDGCNSQEKWKTKVMPTFLGGGGWGVESGCANKVNYGKCGSGV